MRSGAPGRLCQYTAPLLTPSSALHPTSTITYSAKPVPKVKPETRWQKFAKAKGIKKQKRSRMIFDEATQEWKPRFGYKRVNDDQNDWVIPVPGNAGA